MDKDGSIKQYWQKDLQEAKVDVELAQHLGLKSKDAVYLGKFDAQNAEAQIQKWYSDYLRPDQQSITQGEGSFAQFDEGIQTALIDRFENWAQQNRKKYRIESVKKEIKKLRTSTLEPWQVVLALRQLVLSDSFANSNF